jgi:hypothetical protein
LRIYAGGGAELEITTDREKIWALTQIDVVSEVLIRASITCLNWLIAFSVMVAIPAGGVLTKRPKGSRWPKLQPTALQKIINGFVMEKHYSQMRFFNEYY